MTRKQMISTLRGMDFGSTIGSKGDEALRMAIAELEQEPCDTISREAVLNLLDKDRHEYTIQKVKALPSVQPKPIECDDAISRNDMMDAIGHGTIYTSEELQEVIQNLPPVNPKPCDDAISREAAINIASLHCLPIDETVKALERLPSVTQKSGKWIVDRTVVEKTRQYVTYECGYRQIMNYHMDVHCSKCGFKYAYTTDKEDSIPTNYCPNCGAKMVEPQESEDKTK